MLPGFWCSLSSSRQSGVNVPYRAALSALRSLSANSPRNSCRQFCWRSCHCQSSVVVAFRRTYFRAFDLAVRVTTSVRLNHGNPVCAQIFAPVLPGEPH